MPSRGSVASRHKDSGTEVRKPPIIPIQFLNAFRPPSRHKTPPKALGLDLPEGPHTPPETQKELEDVQELSRTQQIQGLAFLEDKNKQKRNNEEDEDSIIDSSSMRLKIKLISISRRSAKCARKEAKCGY